MRPKLTCLAIDDESFGRNLLEDYIEKIPFLELVASCKNAFEALDFLTNQKIDLIISDIQMPGMLGTDFINSLTKKPLVIFVTAYEQYAVESYNIEVVDYLLKPVRFERFLKAVQKAYDLFNLSSTTVQPNYMFLNVEYALVKIMFDDISHIEGLKDYIKIYVKNADHPILTKSTMKGIEEKLPSNQFLRVQKSFIININKIESIRNHRITINKYEIPVSDANMEELMAAINYNKN